MSGKTLYAFYDLDVSPISFDFSAFIICAEDYRVEQKLQDVHFVIVPQGKGKGHHDNALFEDDHADWRLLNIIIPLTQLIPSCKGITISPDRNHASLIGEKFANHIFPENYSVDLPVARHHTGWTIIASHLGKNIQHFSSTLQAREYAKQWIRSHSGGKQCVAITLREAPFGETRNSNPEIWGELAQRLQEADFFPVILRDIDKALDYPLPQFNGITHFPEAVFNLSLRLGFYEEADLCAFVANGPGQLCFYDKNVNFIYVVTGDWLDKRPTPFGKIGIQYGETPPMAHEFQRWIWLEQDVDVIYENIIKLSKDIAKARSNGTYEKSLMPASEKRISL